MEKEKDLQGRIDSTDAPKSTALSGWIISAILIFAAAALLFPFYS